MSGSWEHLQFVIMQVHNRIVRTDFPDIQSLDDDDITQPRSSLRAACLMRDSDSAMISLHRMFLFYVLLRKAEDFHPPLYTIPTETYQQSVAFSPQVTLYFKEDLDDVEEGYSPIHAFVSFRIMGKTAETITNSDLLNLAGRIRTEFATGGGHRWRKGRVKLSYTDRKRGYAMQVHAVSESEGKALINKVLDLQSHTLDNEYLTIQELAYTPPIVPGTTNILGKSRRKLRKRPVGYVRFCYAECHIHGLMNPVVLVDRTQRRDKALISV